MTEALVDRCSAVLSDEDRQHVRRFRFEQHRREATVTRSLVRHALARYIDRPAASFRYRLGPHGRPSLAPPCGVHFNLTNTQQLVACAVSLHEEIGVDVEPIARGDKVLEVAPSVFSIPERAALDGLPLDRRREQALSLWTCKEAYVKARGLGLSAPLLEIDVGFEAGRRPLLRFLSAIDTPDGWWLETRDIDGMRLAVAVRDAGDVKLTVRDLEWPAE